MKKANSDVVSMFTIIGIANRWLMTNARVGEAEVRPITPGRTVEFAPVGMHTDARWTKLSMSPVAVKQPPCCGHSIASCNINARSQLKPIFSELV
jgi:hypothetical protein